MKLDDFLKCKKVRCVSIGNHNFITVGKEYDVVGVDRDSVFIVNDNDSEDAYLYKHFEPVLDTAENPLQDVELTPELETEASEPKFEVGNKVYKYGETDVKTVLEVFEDGYMRISNYHHRVNHEVICHATPENHALLSKPFPAIEFEQPPREPQYLISKGGYWYRPNAKGYTASKHEAGRFSKEFAERHAKEVPEVRIFEDKENS